MKKININNHNWVQAPGYQKNLLLSDKDLQCDGARVQIVTMEPNAVIENHYHATSRELYYVMQGECTVVVNNKSHLLKPGDM